MPRPLRVKRILLSLHKSLTLAPSLLHLMPRPPWVKRILLFLHRSLTRAPSLLPCVNQLMTQVFNTRLMTQCYWLIPLKHNRALKYLTMRNGIRRQHPSATWVMILCKLLLLLQMIKTTNVK